MNIRGRRTTAGSTSIGSGISKPTESPPAGTVAAALISRSTSVPTPTRAETRPCRFS